MSLDFKQMDALEIARLIKGKQITSLEAVDHAIKMIEQENSNVNAVVHTWFDEARAYAKNFKHFDAPFAGVPILVKDLGQTLKGMPSTSGARLMKDYKAEVTSNYVQRLLDAGFIILGNTNICEFGMKFISDCELFGTTKNAIKHGFHAGGSSGGAASAVQSGMVPLAGASDGGGSIRIPASFQGLIGLKPTRGRIATGPEKWRGWAGCSIDFAVTQTIRDTEALLMSMQGSLNPMPFKVKNLTQDQMQKAKEQVSSLRIAYSTATPTGTPVSDDAIRAVKELAENLKQLGFSVAEAKPNYPKRDLVDDYYLVLGAETSAAFNMMEEQIGRPIEIGDVERQTWAWNEYGKTIPAWKYTDRLDVWDQLAKTMDDFYEDYDILLQPSTAFPAPELDKALFTEDLASQLKHADQYSEGELSELMYAANKMGTYYSPFNYIYNITGQPALGLPTYTCPNGLPLGVQCVGRFGREDQILALGERIEASGLLQRY